MGEVNGEFGRGTNYCEEGFSVTAQAVTGAHDAASADLTSSPHNEASSTDYPRQVTSIGWEFLGIGSTGYMYRVEATHLSIKAYPKTAYYCPAGFSNSLTFWAHITAIIYPVAYSTYFEPYNLSVTNGQWVMAGSIGWDTNQAAVATNSFPSVFGTPLTPYGYDIPGGSSQSWPPTTYTHNRGWGASEGLAVHTWDFKYK
jgi:hypothetical protein